MAGLPCLSWISNSSSCQMLTPLLAAQVRLRVRRQPAVKNVALAGPCSLPDVSSGEKQDLSERLIMSVRLHTRGLLKRLPTSQELEQSLHSVVDWLTDADPLAIEEYVNKLRNQNPHLPDAELAKKVVSRKALKCGLVGAATGIPYWYTVPADLLSSWRIQIVMALAVARVYGHTAQTTDLKTDIYLIIAGDTAKEALKQVGIKVGEEISKRVINRVITREVMKQIWKILGRKIITKAGEKSLISFTKMVPLVGAPIGFGFNWVTAKTVGSTAIRYYSGAG